MTENTLQAKGFLVWGICALFFLYEFFLRTVIGAYQLPLMQDLGISSLQFSLLSSTVFLIVYGAMQIPVGLVVDNIGLKKSLLIGAVFCAISSIGFAYAPNYSVAFLFRILMGFGASFGFITLLVSVYEWMPHKYTAIFFGLSQFIGTLGPMLAAGPLETLAAAGLGWRSLFMVMGSIGFILAAAVFFFVENNRDTAGDYVILYKPQSAASAMKKLFSRSQPWFIGLLSALLYFTIEYLSENEGRAFLALKEISPSSAAYMISASWIGYAIGCPLWGFISDLLERRKSVLQVCTLLALTSIITVLYSNQPSFILIGFFMLGLSAGGQCITLALMAEQFKKQYVAVGFGLNNALLNLLAGINAPVIGQLLEYKSGGAAFSLNDYLSVFNILIGISALAVILSLFFIRESYCKSAVSFTILKRS